MGDRNSSFTDTEFFVSPTLCVTDSYKRLRANHTHCNILHLGSRDYISTDIVDIPEYTNTGGYTHDALLMFCNFITVSRSLQFLTRLSIVFSLVISTRLRRLEAMI